MKKTDFLQSVADNVDRVVGIPMFFWEDVLHGRASTVVSLFLLFLILVSFISSQLLTSDYRMQGVVAVGEVNEDCV